MGFKVVRDFLSEKRNRESDVLEKVTDDYKGKNVERVRVYDDDKTLYYEALCDKDSHESAERFHDWSMYDSGTTESKILDDKGNEWKTFIS
ncbi:hypothetical protein INTERNEXUS_143 [Bacillus phage vB_BspM_Internexus]|nr:hypothetical protein INTERNEXUS_143 [Bacillus phage vB_BspM_Internexus]